MVATGIALQGIVKQCTRVMWRFALLGLMLSGCYPAVISTAPRPHQDEAIQAVFELWGVQRKAPFIAWREPWSFDCVGSESGEAVMVEMGTGEGWVSNGKCVYGLQKDPTGQIVLGNIGTSLVETGLVHELAHLVYDDPGHSLQADPAQWWILQGQRRVTEIEAAYK